MMNRSILITVYILVFVSCKERYVQSDNEEFVIEYKHDSANNQRHSYYFNKNNLLIKSTTKNYISNLDYVIYYYDNGLIKSLQSISNSDLNGNTIMYYENGIIKQIQPYDKGKKQGKTIMNYSNAGLKAINLNYNDSTYYVRVYPDSNSAATYREDFIPIILLEKDTAQIGIPFKVNVRFPLFPELGLTKRKYHIHHDLFSSDFLGEEFAETRETSPLTGDDLIITYQLANPGMHTFYCYVTDLSGEKKGPIVHRDIEVFPGK